ncbi:MULTISPECIES: hypothetical protein [Brevundimonas]|uniref:hypothetical protein n=1 Tax=Brevundimonas TaxID=41275 RepID=UPI000F02DC45|nr:hypothetical protein [Brevundimonas lutea]
MSFREQTAWIGLAAMGAFWLWYAFGLYLAVAEARTESSYFVGLLVSGALVCAAVQAGLSLAARRMPWAESDEPDDEREQLVARTGAAQAYQVLIWSVVLVAGVMIAVSSGLRSGTLSALVEISPAIGALIVATLLVMSIGLAEMVRCVVVLRLYRRGF